MASENMLPSFVHLSPESYFFNPILTVICCSYPYRRSSSSESSGSSRKKLFEPYSSSPSLPTNRDIPKSADTPPALTPHKPHGAAIPVQTHEPHQVKLKITQ